MDKAELPLHFDFFLKIFLNHFWNKILFKKSNIKKKILSLFFTKVLR